MSSGGHFESKNNSFYRNTHDYKTVYIIGACVTHTLMLYFKGNNHTQRIFLS